MPKILSNYKNNITKNKNLKMEKNHAPFFNPQAENSIFQLSASASKVNGLQCKSSGWQPSLYLNFFAVYFHCSDCEIHTDRRPLGWGKESFRKSFYQACFSDVCIANQYNFKQVTVVLHQSCLWAWKYLHCPGYLPFSCNAMLLRNYSAMARGNPLSLNWNFLRLDCYMFHNHARRN